MVGGVRAGEAVKAGEAVEEAVLDDLRHERKPLTLFMLGDVDAGKTHTVTALANRFHGHGLTVAVVDADIGQSDIGPPCCVGLGILSRRIKQLSEVPLHSLYFVGNTSPNGYMRECVSGTVMAVQKAKELGADVILVDSTGWIAGEDARQFKLFEQEAIDPSLVVAIENENELELILEDLERRVIRLPKAPEARERTREERRALREAAYEHYFRAARDIAFELPLLTEPAEEGTLVGLSVNASDNSGRDDAEIRGLGIVINLDHECERMTVFTPLDTRACAALRCIRPGGIKLITVKGRLREFKSPRYHPHEISKQSKPQSAENADE